MGKRSENPIKLYSALCRTKIDYGCQIYNTASAGRLKKLDNTHTEGRHKNIYRGLQNFTIRIPTCRSKLPPWNKLGLRFLYKLKSNSSYIDTIYSGQQ